MSNATSATDDRITSLADRYIPVFQVYFAHDTTTFPNAGVVAPIDDNVQDAQFDEVTRIRKRVIQATDKASSQPKTNQLIPLAGPFGPNPGQQTNDVISVEFQESVLKGSLATLTVELFNVYNFSTQQYRYTDPPLNSPSTGPLIDYGVTLALFFGYQNPDALNAALDVGGGNVAPVFEGIITKVELSFPADSAPTVRVTATDKRDRLRAQKSVKPTQFAHSMSEEQIAAAVVGPFGLKVATRPQQKTMPKQPVQRPQDQDVYQFLTDRADKAGLELTCFGDTVFLLTPGDAVAQTALGYTYRQGLTSFSTTLDGNGKSTSVKLTARDPKTQQTYTATVTADDLRTAGMIPPAGETIAEVLMKQGQGGDKQEVVTNYYATSQDQTKNRALGILKRNMDNAFTASGQVIGDPALRAGVALDVQGVGGRYNGPYYVTQATHTFGPGGYQTSFQARRNLAPGANSGAPGTSGGPPATNSGNSV